MTRRTWRMRLLVALAAAGLAAGALTVQEQAQSTRAAWADPEVGRGSMAAGQVLPVQNLSCNKPALASRLDFSWANPAGGLTRQQYRWEFYNPGDLPDTGASPTRTGTLAAGATSVSITVNLGDLLDLGTGHFRIYGVGPGGWETGVQHTYNATTLLLTCGSASPVPR